MESSLPYLDPHETRAAASADGLVFGETPIGFALSRDTLMALFDSELPSSPPSKLLMESPEPTVDIVRCLPSESRCCSSPFGPSQAMTAATFSSPRRSACRASWFHRRELPP